MDDCRDCVKGHCDRWDHLIESARQKAFCESCGDTGFSGCGTGYGDVCSDCGGQSVYLASVRYEQTYVRALRRIAQRMDACIRDFDNLAPAKMSVGDEEVPRCACGGLFKPSLYGLLRCDCCGATWTDPTAEATDPDVGRTLTEVLLAGRRRGNPRWTPSDDDVKVTLHE